MDAELNTCLLKGLVHERTLRSCGLARVGNMFDDISHGRGGNKDPLCPINNKVTSYRTQKNEARLGCNINLVKPVFKGPSHPV